MNRDIAVGMMQQAIGTVMALWGVLADDPGLQKQGSHERHIGRARVLLGRGLGGAADNIRRALRQRRRGRRVMRQ